MTTPPPPPEGSRPLDSKHPNESVSRRPRRPPRWWVDLIGAPLGILFLLTGASKLAGMEMVVEMFARWGYPRWFMFMVGAVEMAGGGLLLTKQLKRLGAMVIVVVMVGAIGTHVTHGEWAFLIGPAVILSLAIVLIALRRRPTRSDRPPIH